MFTSISLPTRSEFIFFRPERSPLGPIVDHLNRIPDPFLGRNELKCEWVGERSWTYQTELPAVSPPENGTQVALAFEGLDTFATVKLNDEIILTTSNQFTPYRVDVTNRMKYGAAAMNILTIDFACAFQRAREIKDAHPEHKWVGFNGDTSRLAVRKAQYHW
jgi:beta-mannosidase